MKESGLPEIVSDLIAKSRLGCIVIAGMIHGRSYEKEGNLLLYYCVRYRRELIVELHFKCGINLRE